jgi:hypothetical protein
MGTWKRIIVLIGSIACGLTISNILYLYFLSTDEGINPAISGRFSPELDTCVTRHRRLATLTFKLPNYAMDARNVSSYHV